MFISFKVSLIRFFLMRLSNGVSVVKLGVWLTSNNIGYNFSFIKMSIPSISKHILLAKLSG